jgi:hypothetical protein
MLEGGIEMTEEDICLTCGERMFLAIVMGGHAFICPVCDEDEEYIGEDPCSCRNDEINPYCAYCYG